MCHELGRTEILCAAMTACQRPLEKDELFGHRSLASKWVPKRVLFQIMSELSLVVGRVFEAKTVFEEPPRSPADVMQRLVSSPAGDAAAPSDNDAKKPRGIVQYQARLVSCAILGGVSCH